MAETQIQTTRSFTEDVRHKTSIAMSQRTNELTIQSLRLQTAVLVLLPEPRPWPGRRSVYPRLRFSVKGNEGSLDH